MPHRPTPDPVCIALQPFAVALGVRGGGRHAGRSLVHPAGGGGGGSPSSVWLVSFGFWAHSLVRCCRLRLQSSPRPGAPISRSSSCPFLSATDDEPDKPPVALKSMDDGQLHYGQVSHWQWAWDQGFINPIDDADREFVVCNGLRAGGGGGSPTLGAGLSGGMGAGRPKGHGGAPGRMGRAALGGTLP